MHVPEKRFMLVRLILLSVDRFLKARMFRYLVIFLIRSRCHD